MACGIGQHLNFAGRFRLVIDSVGRTEQRGLHAQAALEQQFGEIQFELNLRLRNGVEFRMREGVIADFVALQRTRA